MIDTSHKDGVNNAEFKEYLNTRRGYSLSDADALAL